jgi:hypothetical protein
MFLSVPCPVLTHHPSLLSFLTLKAQIDIGKTMPALGHAKVEPDEDEKWSMLRLHTTVPSNADIDGSIPKISAEYGDVIFAEELKVDEQKPIPGVHAALHHSPGLIGGIQYRSSQSRTLRICLRGRTMTCCSLPMRALLMDPRRHTLAFDRSTFVPCKLG